MKVYYFYLVKNHISIKKYKGVIKNEIIRVGNKECVLYAYTPEKASKKYFNSTRNMELFFEKEIDMSREDYEEFCELHSNQLLEYHLFNTKYIDNGIYKTKCVYMLCTKYESDHILYYREELVLNYISKTVPDNIMKYIEKNHFKKELQEIMDDIFLYSYLITKIYPMEDINYDTFMVDDISLFVKLFSNTFKMR